MKSKYHVPNIQILQCRYCWVQWPVEWPRNMSFEAEFWRIYYQPETDVRLRCNGEVRVLPAGRPALIPPRTVYMSDMEAGFRQFYIHFVCSRPYADYPPGIYLPDCDAGQMALIEDLMQELENPPAVLPVSIGMQIMALVLGTLLKLPKPGGQELSRAVEESRLYIDKNYPRNLSNSELARRSGMATNSFARLFRTEMGMTAQQYIRQQRVMQATLLLRYSNHSLADIAEMCGFGNRYYFTRVFIRSKGYAPAEFRKLALT